jgi:hypothetical protein
MFEGQREMNVNVRNNGLLTGLLTEPGLVDNKIGLGGIYLSLETA